MDITLDCSKLLHDLPTATCEAILFLLPFKETWNKRESVIAIILFPFPIRPSYQTTLVVNHSKISPFSRTPANGFPPISCLCTEALAV